MLGDDFYFAYDLNKKKKTASRLYRYFDDMMERYNPETGEWQNDPDQCCIFCGEDIFYDEVTAEEAEKLTVLM